MKEREKAKGERRKVKAEREKERSSAARNGIDQPFQHFNDFSCRTFKTIKSVWIEPSLPFKDLQKRQGFIDRTTCNIQEMDKFFLRFSPFALRNIHGHRCNGGFKLLQQTVMIAWVEHPGALYRHRSPSFKSSRWRGAR